MFKHTKNWTRCLEQDQCSVCHDAVSMLAHRLRRWANIETASWQTEANIFKIFLIKDMFHFRNELIIVLIKRIINNTVAEGLRGLYRHIRRHIRGLIHAYIYIDVGLSAS